MTLISIDIRHPDAAGLAAADGRLEWKPTARRNVDGSVVLPAPFSVRLEGGLALVDVEPSGAGWAWNVGEYVQGGSTRTVIVPDAETANYADLVTVDPATLEPTAEPVAAWWLALDSIKLTEDPDAPGLYMIGA